MEKFRPFCSRECRDRDLINWLDGTYAVPVVGDEEDEDPVE
ncbi:DNA gyrase inhibitor YacG [Arboricoccus pini]|nr:DNA gyrase inhibitor YacG [Arboricoccus pini]